MTSFELKRLDSPGIRYLLATRPNYKIIQVNGERIYEPINEVPDPGEGTEVYVFQIPNTTSEDELVPFFDMIAPVYKLRLKINFSGGGRGYAYVQYFDPFSAQKAVRNLNDLQLKPGVKLEMRLSDNNKRLKIENIPQNQVDGVMTVIKEGVIEQTYRYNRQVLELKYVTHALASKARRSFVASPYWLIFDMEWLPPSVWKEEITSIWIKGLNDKHQKKTERVIKRMCSLTNSVAKSVEKIDNYLLITFATRMDAKLAFCTLNQMCESYGFEVCWNLKTNK